MQQPIVKDSRSNTKAKAKDLTSTRHFFPRDPGDMNNVDSWRRCWHAYDVTVLYAFILRVEVWNFVVVCELNVKHNSQLCNYPSI